MKKTIRSFFTAAISLATLLITGSALALTEAKVITASDLKNAAWNNGVANIGGWTVTLNGNTLNADGTISISQSATAGVTVHFPAAVSQYTVLMKYSDYTRAASNYTALMDFKNSNSGGAYVGMLDDGSARAFYVGTVYTSFDNIITGSTKTPTPPAAGMMGISYKTGGSGLGGFLFSADGSFKNSARRSGITWSGSTISDVTLGGLLAGQSHEKINKPASLKISGIAIFTDYAITADDANALAAYEFPGVPPATMMYSNPLAGGSDKVPAGAYGDITVPVAGLKATAFSAQTKVTDGTGSYSRIQTNDTQTHTVSGWFKFNNRDCTIYGARTGSGNDRGYRLYCDSNGQLYVGKINFNNNAYSWNGTPVQVTSTALTANTWYYITVAVTKLSGERNANAAVFVNGVQTYSGSDKFPTNLNGSSCTDFEIGAGVSVAGLYVDTTAVADATKIKRWATNESLVEVLPVVVKTQVYEGAALTTTSTRLFPNLTLAELKKCTFGAKFNSTSMTGTPKAGAALVVDSATDDTKLTVQFQVDAYNHNTDKHLKFANIEFTEANGGISAKQVSAGYVNNGGPDHIGEVRAETNGGYQINELVIGTPDVPMPYCFHLDHDLYNSGSGSIKRATKQGDGTAAWSADKTYGKFGYGHMLLNGQDYSYVVEDANGLALAEKGWTISLWVNPNNMGVWQDVFGFDLGENRFKLERQEGNSFAIYSSNQSYNITDIAYPDNNAWMHLAFAYAADGTLNVYLDGKLVKTSTIVANGNLTKLIMGTNGVYDGGTVRNSSAMIDEVAIYGGTLDLARISWLAKNAPSALPYEKVASMLPGEGYLTTTSQLVWKNMKLADIMEFHGTVSGKNIDGTKVDHPACFVVNDGTTATMNFQINNDGGLSDVRGVTAEFTQVGKDVYGRVISAYYSGDNGSFGSAYWGEKEFTWSSGRTVSTGDNVSEYGCKAIFAYCLPQVPPQDITVHGSEVKISAINELVEEGATIADVTLDANARVKFDAVAAIDYNFVCSGALTFVGFPGQQELAKYDFSGITGGYKQAAKVIGINFSNGTGADRWLGDSEDAGVPGFTFPGKGWTQTTSNPGSNVALKVYDSATDSVSECGAKASWDAQGTYDCGVSCSAIVRGYLDDATGKQVKITSVTGIPFDAYDVIIFTSTDNDNKPFSPKMVNGVLYSSDANGNARLASSWSDNWGVSKSATIVMGKNAMRVNNIVGDLSIISGKNANGARGCIAAIMIVERQLRIGDEYVFANGDCTETNNGGVGGYKPNGLTVSPIGGITTDVGIAVKDVTLVLENTSSAKASYITINNAAGESVNSGAPSIGGQWLKQDMSELGPQVKWMFDTPQEITIGTEATMSASGDSRVRLYKTTENIRGCYLRLNNSMGQWRPAYAVTTVITSLPTYEAEIDGEENWGDLEWSNVPTEGVEAVLTVVSDSTLTMDGTEEFDTLKLVGEDDLTIVDIKGADVAKVDVSEFTGALTFEIDATEGLTAGAALLEYIKTAPTTMKFVFKGSDSNGATLTYGDAGTIETHIVFEDGTHSLTMLNGNHLFAQQATDENPTVWVKGTGTTLTFKSKDLAGYGGGSDIAGVIRVDAGNTLHFTQDGSSTFHYRQRLYLEPGSLTKFTFSGDQFRWFGGTTEALAQIYVPASDSDQSENPAIIQQMSGNGIRLTNDGTAGVAVFVGENSKLKIDSAITQNGNNNRSLVKYGAGELELARAVGNTSLEINAGKLTICDAVQSLVLNNNTTIGVPSGSSATVAAISGTGAITKTGDGTLNLPSGYTSTVTLEGGLLNSDFAGTLVIMGTMDTASYTSFPIAATIAPSGNNGIIKLSAGFVDGQLIKFSGTAPESIAAAGLTILDASGNDITADLSIDEDGYIARSADTITATLNEGIYYWSEMPWDDEREWEDGLKAILTIDYETVYLVVDSPVSASIVLDGTGNVVFTCADNLACDTIDATELTGKITFSSSNVTTIHAGDNDVDYTYSGNAQSVALNIETTGAIKVESIGSTIDIDAGEASQLTYDYKGNAEISPTIAASVIVFDNSSSTAHGVVALNAASKIADTISIEKNATIKVANAAAISGTTISGSGTIILPTSGNTVPTAPTGVADSENWTGTVWIQVANGTNAGWSVANFGNSKSTVRLSGAFGYLQTASASYDAVLDINLELDNNGGTYAWKGNSGWSKHYLGLSSLSGNGDFDKNATGVSYAYYFANGNDFHGSINVAGGGYSFIFGNETPAADANNEIVVGAGAAMTLGEGKTWTAGGGIKIKATASIGGAGTLASATTLESGATIDATKGTLKANAAPTFGESLNVTLPAAQAAAGYKILTLTNAAEKYLNVDVTVKDDDAKDYILEQKADGIYLVEKGANGVVINIPENEEVTKTLITGLDYEKTGLGTLLVNGTIAGTLTVSEGTAVIMPGASIGTIIKSGTGDVLYRYIVTINDCGEFTVPTGVDPTKVSLYRTDGTIIENTTIKDGKILYTPEFYGKNAWLEYLFKGTLVSTGRDTGSLQFDGNHCFPGNEYVLDGEGVKAGGIYAASAPWRNLTFPNEVTVVMYGKVMKTSNTCQIGIGSTTGGSKYTLFLASGDVTKEEVVLGYAYNNTGSNVESHDVLCRMTVPHAQTTEHLYAFTLKKVGDDTVVNIYLDGELLQPYTFKNQTVTLGSGIQLGSIHGGIGNGQTWPADFGFKRSTDVETDATLDFVRVYDVELNNKVLRAIAKDYPYESPAGSFNRTLTGNENWIETDAWTKVGDTEMYDEPDAGSSVTITPPVEADVTLTSNLMDVETFEAMTFNAGGKITVVKGEDATGEIVVAGRTTISTDTQISIDAMELGGAVSVAANKTLTFDFSSLDLSNEFADRSIRLTGAAILGDGAKIEATGITIVGARTATIVYDEGTQQYSLEITVDETVPFTYTGDSWSWGTQSNVDEDIVAANTGFAIVVESGTLEWTLDRASFTINGGTLKATAAPTAACAITVNEDGTFDLGTIRGLTVAGDGSIKATITAAEQTSGSFTLFKQTEDSDISSVTLVNEAGETLTPSSADFDEDGNYVVAFSVAITAQPREHTYAASVTWGDGTQTATFVENVAMIPAGATNVKVQFSLESIEYAFSTGSTTYEVELDEVTEATTVAIPDDIVVGPSIASTGTTFADTKFFPSLASAVASVEDGGTVTMIASDANVATITKSVTIKVGASGQTPNSINVNATADTGVTINLASGGTVDGEITVSGGTVNFQTADDNVSGNFIGTLNYSSGTVTRKHDYTVNTPNGYIWYGTGTLTLVYSEFTWIGASGDNWNDPTKWQGGVVPVAGSRVIINLDESAGDYTINLPEDTAALEMLTLSGSATRFAFAGTGSLSATSYDIGGLTATTLDLSKTTFNAAYTIPANSTLIVNGATWTSEATFAADTSKIRYAGTYTAIGGTFAGEKGTVEFGGTYNAAAGTRFTDASVKYSIVGTVNVESGNFGFGTVEFSLESGCAVTVAGNFLCGEGNGSKGYFNGGTLTANKIVIGTTGSGDASEDYYFGDGNSVNDTMVITANEIYNNYGNQSTGMHVHVRNGCTINVSNRIWSDATVNHHTRQWFLEGGKFVFTGNCSVVFEQLRSVTGTTEFEVAGGKTLTLTVKAHGSLTKTGVIRKTGTGTIVFADNPAASFTIAAGTAIVDAGNEGTVSVDGEGSGVLKVKVAYAQWISGYTSPATVPGGKNIVFVLPDSTEITGEGNVLPPKAADRKWVGTTDNNWNVATNWEPEVVPGENDSVEIDSTDKEIAITVPNGGVTVGGITFKGGNAIALTGDAINVGVVVKADAGSAEFVGGTIATSIQVVGGTLAISGDYTLPAAIATESGATLELDVASAKTITSVISGAGAFKKTGAGTLTMNGLSSYTGGTTVEAGGIVFGATSSKNVGPIGAYYTNSTTDWDYNKAVVKNGAFIDVNGKQDMCYSFELEADALLKNAGSTIGDTSRQTRRVALLGNATVDAVNNAFGIHNGGHALTQLVLGEYTLTKIGNGAFELVNTVISGTGTIDVQAGTLWFNTTGSAMNDGTIKLGANGALRVSANATVKNFIANNTAITGNGTLSVTGLLDLSAVENNTLQAVNLTLTEGMTFKFPAGYMGESKFTLCSGTLTPASGTLNANIDFGNKIEQVQLVIADKGITFEFPDTTWTGGESGEETDWDVATNWTHGVPKASTAVTIPAGANIALTASSTAASITLEGSATLTMDGVTAANIKSIAVPTGATLTINVEEGNTATVGLISGAGAVAKSGAGTLTLSAANTFAGGVVINGGVVTRGAANAFGAANTVVEVKSGASLNWGDTALVGNAYRIKIAGTGAGEGKSAFYTSTNNSTLGSGSQRHPISLELTDDATIGGAYNFGIMYQNGKSYNVATVTLNDHTLTKVGSGIFYTSNIEFSNGTVVVDEGTLSVINNMDNDTFHSNAKLVVGENGHLQAFRNLFTVYDVEFKAAANAVTKSDNNHKFIVKGTATGSFSAEKLEIAAGATIKLAQGESVSASNTLTLPTEGTITLDVTGYNTVGDYTVITAPNNYTWVTTKVTLVGNEGWEMYVDDNELKVKLLTLDADISTSEGYNYTGVSIDVDVTRIAEGEEAYIRVVVKDTDGKPLAAIDPVEITGKGLYQVPVEGLTTGADYTYEVTIVDETGAIIEGSKSDDGTVTLGDVQKSNLFSASAETGASDVDGGSWTENEPTIPTIESESEEEEEVEATKATYYQIADDVTSVFTVDTVEFGDLVSIDFEIAFDEGFTTEIDQAEDTPPQAGVTISAEAESATKYWYVCDNGAWKATTTEAIPGAYTVTMEFDYPNKKVRYSINGTPLTDSSAKVWFANGVQDATEIATVAFTGDSRLTKFGANAVTIDTNLAESDNTKYATVEDVVGAINAGTSITLLTNVSVDSAALDAGEYTIDLDNNKFKWSADVSKFITFKDGKFVVKEITEDDKPKNGVDSYTSYVFNLDAEDPADKPFIKQTGDVKADKLTFKCYHGTGGAAIVPRDGAKATYQIEVATDPAFGTGTMVETSPKAKVDQPIDVELPSDTSKGRVLYYRAKLNAE